MVSTVWEHLDPQDRPAPGNGRALVWLRHARPVKSPRPADLSAATWRQGWHDRRAGFPAGHLPRNPKKL